MVWPPAGLEDDPLEGDHFANDWHEALNMLKAYAARSTPGSAEPSRFQFNPVGSSSPRGALHFSETAIMEFTTPATRWPTLLCSRPYFGAEAEDVLEACNGSWQVVLSKPETRTPAWAALASALEILQQALGEVLRSADAMDSRRLSGGTCAPSCWAARRGLRGDVSRLPASPDSH